MVVSLSALSSNLAKWGKCMSNANATGVSEISNETKTSDRRSFLRRASLMGAAAGATGLIGFDNLMSLAAAQPKFRRPEGSEAGVEKGDFDILIAAQIAEALAVTTYFNIIEHAPFFSGIPNNDQRYLVAAYNEEMSHFLLEKSVTQTHTPFTSFFYPKGMFSNTQVTLNTLVTLEDAFIAAYLVGVRNFSTPDLRVTSARIMGIESDHRTLARVIGPDVPAKFGGPIDTITGLAGVAENVDPPNNNAYERTACWTDISQALTALTPFVDIATAQKAGFDVSRSFAFDSFQPKIFNKLGDFISFAGC
jgi:Ferritin-like domain